MNVSRWTTRPLPSRTVRVTETSLPSTGYSVRCCSPGRSDEVYCVVSYPATTFLTIGLDHVVVRPFGTLQISKWTMPGDACDRIITGCVVSFRKRIVCESETVASRPSGYRVM